MVVVHISCLHARRVGEVCLEDIGIKLKPYFNLGGKIKEKTRDFVVREVLKGRKLDIKYSLTEKIKDRLLFLRKKKKYLHFTLVKENLSTFDFLEILRRRGLRRVWYCGVKDKFAVTSQRICVLSKDFKKIPKRGKGFFIKSFSFEDHRLGIGMHDGNYFEIIIRKKVSEGDIRIMEKFKEKIEEGIPNFYGPQRFGIRSPNNHVIGKLIIRRKFEEACFEILSRLPEAERFWGNWKKMMNSLLRRDLWVERTLLKSLQKFGNFERAIHSLPGFLLRMWIDAYQSYLFNLTLSECINRGIFVEKIPLVSHYLKLEKLGDVGEIIKEILEKEDMRLEDFRVRKRMRPRSKYRKAFLYPREFTYKVERDKIFLNFLLEKGEYATTLLYFLGILPRR